MTTSASLNPRWQPSGHDHLIYEWVKMQGKTQSEVAGMFGIDQSTVSRTIQRYERWQAHAKDRENGRLDRSERLRAQRWLTYERNELILASCLRIAQEMEGFTELSKSTIRRPIDQPSKQSEVRTEDRVIDRHGVAARYLRLAFRVNMEQLKLVSLLEPPSAAPLTDQELADEARQAALDAAEISAARRHADQAAAKSVGWDKAAPAADGPPLGGPAGSSGCSQPELEGGIDRNLEPSVPPDSTPNLEPETLNSAVMHPVHNLHSEDQPEIAATTGEPCTCVMQVRLEKNSLSTCIIDCDPSPWPIDDVPTGAQQAVATAAAS